MSEDVTSKLIIPRGSVFIIRVECISFVQNIVLISLQYLSRPVFVRSSSLCQIHLMVFLLAFVAQLALASPYLGAPVVGPASSLPHPQNQWFFFGDPAQRYRIGVQSPNSPRNYRTVLLSPNSPRNYRTVLQRPNSPGNYRAVLHSPEPAQRCRAAAQSPNPAHSYRVIQNAPMCYEVSPRPATHPCFLASSRSAPCLTGRSAVRQEAERDVARSRRPPAKRGSVGALPAKSAGVGGLSLPASARGEKASPVRPFARHMPTTGVLNEHCPSEKEPSRRRSSSNKISSKYRLSSSPVSAEPVLPSGLSSAATQFSAVVRNDKSSPSTVFSTREFIEGWIPDYEAEKHA